MSAPSASRPMTGGVLMNASRQVAAGVAAAGSTVVVARTLGPSGAGAYAVVQAAIAVMTVATTLGIENGVIFRVAAGLWEAGDAVRATLKVSLVAGSIGAAIGIGSRVLFPAAFDGLSVPLTVIALAVVPIALATIFTTSCAVAINRYEVYAVIPSLQAVLVLVATAIGAWTFGLTGAVVGTTVGIGAVGCGAIAWGLGLPLSEPKSQVAQLRAALRFGIASYGANALQIVNYRLDLFILSVVASSAAVGHYAVAVAVSSTLWLLPRGLSDLLFPRVAQLGGPGGEEQRAVVEAKALRHATLAIGITAVVLGVAVELLMVPVFGEAFQSAIALTLILIPGAALVALAGVFAASVTGRGKPTYGFYAAIVTTPLTVILYISLIPSLHATGAALASTLSYATSFVLYAWFYRRASGTKVLPLLVPTRSEIDDLRALPRRLRGESSRTES